MSKEPKFKVGELVYVSRGDTRCDIDLTDRERKELKEEENSYLATILTVDDWGNNGLYYRAYFFNNGFDTYSTDGYIGMIKEHRLNRFD